MDNLFSLLYSADVRAVALPSTEAIRQLFKKIRLVSYPVKITPIAHS
ncbi:hypothetical protein NDAWWUGD_CDS0124 [Salmonella phage SeKF_80]